MSWMKRAQGGAGTGAGSQPYAAPQAQPFPNQQNMYPNYPGSTGTGAPQQAPLQPQYWQAPPPSQAPQPQQQQYNQQYAQVYQQEYPPNANPMYQQQAQYNHNYTNPGYTNTQQSYQQNYYQNQPTQQNYPQNSTNNDGWEDNWDWGWEESAKQAQKAQNAAQHQPAQQERVFNNANVLEESFAQTNTWNWAMDDKKESKESAVHPPERETNEPSVVPPDPLENSATLEPDNLHSVNNSAPMPTEEVRTLSDRDVVKERLPNLALGKRFHLDNLTPQWSIESQMSQESSDGPQTHSESTYRSENQSRNSNSPGPNTDNSNYNYSQPGLDEVYRQNSDWSKRSDETTLTDNTRTGSRKESHDELSRTMQDLTLANHEKPSLENVQISQTAEPANSQPNIPCSQPTTASQPPPVSVSYPFPPSKSMPPPPPAASLSQPPAAPPVLPPSVNLPPTPILSSAVQHGPPAANISQPSPVSTPASLPPPNFQPPSNSQNPFKHAGSFAHKPKASSSSASVQPFPSQVSNANLASPAAVSKVAQQSRIPAGFEANLETTPDNSERPDQPQAAAYRPMAAPHQVPDNMEVAPQNDRNEYLQTAHLSSGDYGENTDFTRGAPPPGLRRMVVGQQESEYEPGAHAAGDEPPPGLARMVPGQQTEGDGDDYRDRLIDGQPPDGGGRPYRRADGQRTPDTYGQPPARRPLGLDRMVPGESSAEYSQYQTSVFPNGSEHRVVTGFERDFAAPPDAREQNVDGSDYTERGPDDRQREGTMEGENLQDLGAVPAPEPAYAREAPPPRAAADSASPERPAASPARRSSDDTDRDRSFKASPRRDRGKTSRDRDRDDRYPRPDRKHDRDDRKSVRDDRRSDRDRRDRRERDRREREESPDARRKRRSARSHRYETEDTDYYSDKERDRRRHREGSYSSKPPRPEEGERSRRRAGEPARRDRHERVYRDIDPERRHGNRRRDRDHERRRVTFSRDAKANDSSRSEGEAYSPGGSRSESREATATDEDVGDGRRRLERRHRHSSRRNVDPYYDSYGTAASYGDPYLAQRQQYEYYERLRLSDPVAYMQVYKQLMAGRVPDHARRHDPLEGYGGDERASVHSGRSSAAGLKGHDTYFPRYEGSLRDAPSLRTDNSDRDLTTEVSLPTNLDASTVRSERMTPHRFSTAHVKGSISSRHLVVVRGSWPADGRPAPVRVLALPPLLAADPDLLLLQRSPGPLIKGVTHKKTVVDYCERRARAAREEAARDQLGYALLWDLLALLLRQNGVVIGSDIAELLMKSTREYEYNTWVNKSSQDGSRRTSSVSGSEEVPPDVTHVTHATHATNATSGLDVSGPSRADEQAVLRAFREHLLCGDRQEALECAMSGGLWGHALQLAGASDRRTRGAVSARFVSAAPPSDPLHTLYAALAGATPPAVTMAGEARGGDWRPHAAIVLANVSSRPEHHARTLTALGDSLSSRGLVYSAQFCYVSGGVPFSRHPLAPLSPAGAPGAAPPRLALLLSEPRAASLAQLAPSVAILATEIYEYALSLHQDYVIPELQVYKFVLACRLVDCGLYERALGYVEQAARAVTRAPGEYPRGLVRRLAELGDRLQHVEAAPLEDPPLVDKEAEGSPRHHQWLLDVTDLAQHTMVERSQHSTPLHLANDYYAQQQQHQQQEQQFQQQHQEQQQQFQQQQQEQQQQLQQQQQYSWDQAHQYQQQQQLTPPAPYPETEEVQPADVTSQVAYDDWNRTEEYHTQAYTEPPPAAAWPPYHDGASEGADAGRRPMITMPGAPPSRPYDYDDNRPPSAEQPERETETPKSSRPAEGKTAAEGRGKGGGWLGGILTKLSLRPPNQMILPDDKNPTIVWDAEHKRWRNLDGDEAEGDQPPPPPPRAADLAPALHAMGAPPSGAPSAAPVSNIFKMQKGRHIKKSYVDVFNPGGASRPAPPPAPAPLPGPAPPPGPAPSYFVPAPLQTVHVLIPPSPSATPPPAPIPDKEGEYEPAPEYARSGI